MGKQVSEKLYDFFSGFKKLSFKKGETILRPDEETHGVFYLYEGYTRLYSISKNAQELTLIIYRPGDFFPLIPAINNSPMAYYTEAITAVKLYRTPQNEFIKFTKNNSDVMFEVSAHVLERFGGVLTRMEHAMFGNARSKVASIILICAERFGRQDKRDIIIQVPLTHQDIAKLIGMARETVSIEMKKLQKMHLIDYRGKYLVVKNYQKLKGESALGL